MFNDLTRSSLLFFVVGACGTLGNGSVNTLLAFLQTFLLIGGLDGIHQQSWWKSSTSFSFFYIAGSLMVHSWTVGLSSELFAVFSWRKRVELILFNLVCLLPFNECQYQKHNRYWMYLQCFVFPACSTLFSFFSESNGVLVSINIFDGNYVSMLTSIFGFTGVNFVIQLFATISGLVLSFEYGLLMRPITRQHKTLLSELDYPKLLNVARMRRIIVVVGMALVLIQAINDVPCETTQIRASCIAGRGIPFDEETSDLSAVITDRINQRDNIILFSEAAFVVEQEEGRDHLLNYFQNMVPNDTIPLLIGVTYKKLQDGGDSQINEIAFITSSSMENVLVASNYNTYKGALGVSLQPNFSYYLQPTIADNVNLVLMVSTSESTNDNKQFYKAGATAIQDGHSLLFCSNSSQSRAVDARGNVQRSVGRNPYVSTFTLNVQPRITTIYSSGGAFFVYFWMIFGAVCVFKFNWDFSSRIYSIILNYFDQIDWENLKKKNNLSQPDRNQGKSLTCYAHVIARIMNNLVRLISGVNNDQYYDNIYNSAVNNCKRLERNKQDCGTVSVMRRVLEDPNIVDLFRGHDDKLVIKKYDEKSLDHVKTAVKQQRYIVCEIWCPKRVMTKIFEGRGLITSSEVAKYFVGKQSKTITGHAVALCQYIDEKLYFKNTQGLYGRLRQCVMEEEVVRKSKLKFRFIDLTIEGFEVPFNHHYKPDNLMCVDSKQLIPNNNILCGSGIQGRVHPGVYSDFVFFGLEYFYAQHTVAIKSMELDEDEIKRTKKLLFSFRHPNIVKYYGYSESKLYDGWRLYIAMAKAKCSLQHFIEKRIEKFGVLGESNGGNLGWALLMYCITDVASGIEHLHQFGLIHNDIHVCNILVQENFIFQIGDLESMVQFNENIQNVRSHSKYYSGSSANNAFNCDIWCLGSLMCHLLTGQPNPQKNVEAEQLRDLISYCRSDHDYRIVFNIEHFEKIVKRMPGVLYKEMNHFGTVDQFVTTNEGKRRSFVKFGGILMEEKIPECKEIFAITNNGDKVSWKSNLAVFLGVFLVSIYYFVGLLILKYSILVPLFPDLVPIHVKVLPRNMQTNVVLLHDTLKKGAVNLKDYAKENKLKELLDLSTKMAVAIEPAIMHYIHLIDHHHAEYVFGNPYEERKVRAALNVSRSSQLPFDMISEVGLILYRLHRGVSNQIHSIDTQTGGQLSGNRYLNTSTNIFKPVGYNHVKHFSRVDELLSLHINLTLIPRFDDAVAKFQDSTAIVNGRTLGALQQLCKNFNLSCVSSDEVYANKGTHRIQSFGTITYFRMPIYWKRLKNRTRREFCQAVMFAQCHLPRGFSWIAKGICGEIICSPKCTQNFPCYAEHPVSDLFSNVYL